MTRKQIVRCSNVVIAIRLLSSTLECGTFWIYSCRNVFIHILRERPHLDQFRLQWSADHSFALNSLHFCVVFFVRETNHFFFFFSKKFHRNNTSNAWKRFAPHYSGLNFSERTKWSAVHCCLCMIAIRPAFGSLISLKQFRCRQIPRSPTKANGEWETTKTDI